MKADPAADALSRLNELSGQAVQSRDAVTTAQLDLEAKLAAQTTAEGRHRADVAALEAANTQLQTRQAGVDRVAAMTYMSGRNGLLAAVLTAGSPVASATDARVAAARAISARFPEIAYIDGVRPDSKPWHPRGLAIDVMIPNSESAAGIALGNEILAFAMSNAARFGLQDVIWRDTYYTPGGPQGSDYGHYDHVHITTRPSR